MQSARSLADHYFFESSLYQQQLEQNFCQKATFRLKFSAFARRLEHQQHPGCRQQHLYNNTRTTRIKMFQQHLNRPQHRCQQMRERTNARKAAKRPQKRDARPRARDPPSAKPLSGRRAPVRRGGRHTRSCRSTSYSARKYATE